MKHSRANHLTSVIKNVIWLLSERGLQIALSLFVGGLIARAFGPDLYGKWQYAISLLFIATTLTHVCSAEVIVPKLVRQPDTAGSILGTAFVIRAAASVAGFIVGQLIVYIWIKDKEVAGFIQIILLLLLFIEPFSVVTAWFQSRTHIAPVVKIRLAVLVIKSLAITAIFFFSVKNLLVAVAWVGEGVLVMLLLLFLYRRALGPSWRVSRSNIRSYLKEGVGYWIGLLFMCIFMRLDRFFLAESVGFNSLGIYSAAIQISENWFVLAAILSQSIAPRFIYSNISRETIDKNIQRLLMFYVALAVLGSIVLAMLAPIIIEFIFGSSYEGAIHILRYTAFVSIGVFVDSLFNILMLKEHAAIWVGVKWMVVLSVAFLINYLFIPVLGLQAPILALFVGYSVASLIGMIYWLLWRQKSENLNSGGEVKP